MRSDLHPAYYPDAVITCACGKTYAVGSTQKTIHVEICANCHPFYTGKQKLVDTARRVERFEERLGKRAAIAAVRKGRKVKKAIASVRKAAKKPKLEREEGLQPAPPATGIR